MDSNTTSVFMQHQQLLMRRPQSLFDPSIAVIPMQQGGQSLPSHQQQFPHFVQPTRFATTNNHQSNTVKHMPDANAQQQSLSASRGGGGRSSPYPHAAVILAEKHNQEQQHPQIWCGKGQAEPIASKHVYNYAQRAESEEKTPMCCVAELARFNKLRHEYVLLDESGPAHKKKFTVRLRICHGQEFEGSGPSIKKAQQAAAQQALNSTTLSRPPQLRGVKRSVRKEETSNPVLLLNSVASQLGFHVHYREELIRQPPSAASPFKETNPPNFSSFSPVQFPPQLCYAPHALPSTTPSCSSIQLLPPNRGLASLLDLALVGPLPAALPFPPFQTVNGFSSLLSPPFFSLPSPSLFLPGLPPSPLKGPSLLGPSPMQNISYKVTITLGLDSSEHIGTASNLPAAKQKAATLALAHLKPDLERLKRDREEQLVPSSAKQQGDQLNQLQDCQLDPICSPSSASPSSTAIPSSESTTPESGEIGGGNWEDDADGAVETEGMGKEATESQPQQRREGEEEGVARPPTRRKTKSVVSQIHECALRLKMNIEFEVLAERGEPHNRVYILRCRLTGPTPSTGPGANKQKEAREFVAEGRGPSKKAAKQAVCQQLLGQVRHLIDDDPIHLATQIVRQIAGAEGATAPQLRGRGGANHAVGGGQANGGRELAKRRTIIKDRKIDPEYGHHINPVSRLIQVMQAHQEKEPHFQLVAEQGLNRHKEFTVAVQCMGMQEQGTGPNKKLAKRAAAEAMLAKIGYVKPMPQPGKSLLKKKTDQNGGEGLLDFMEIGHFNAAELAEENSGWTGTAGEGEQQKEKWKEGRPDTLHTFADVEQAMRQEEGRGEESACSPPLVTKQHSEEEEGEAGQSPNSPSPPGEGEDGQPGGAVRSQRRRVTFSEHVSACPPPEDSNYPAASVAPLKSELGGRLKRRSRDSQRMLSEEETRRMAEMAKLFLGWRAAERERRGFVDLATGEWTGQVDGVEALGAEMEALGLATDSRAALLANPPPPVQLQPEPILSSPLLPANKFANALPDVPGHASPEEPSNCSAKLALIRAKPFLRLLAKQFKFSVAYSDFPKTSNAADKEQCFTLLTLGLFRPIVCHGSGPTEADAHNDAAFNAIRTQLSQLD